jgi:uncharacterized protein YndB with AHSA1/START domain
MEKIIASAVIHKPVERVYDYATNPKTNSEWQLDKIERTTLSSGTGAATAKIQLKVHGWAGATMNLTQEIMEHIPNQQITTRFNEAHGWLNASSQWKFEPVAEGTNVTMQHEIDLHGWLRWVGPVFMYVARRKVEDDLSRLIAQLEKA